MMPWAKLRSRSDRYASNMGAPQWKVMHVQASINWDEESLEKIQWMVKEYHPVTIQESRTKHRISAFHFSEKFESAESVSEKIKSDTLWMHLMNLSFPGKRKYTSCLTGSPVCQLDTMQLLDLLQTENYTEKGSNVSCERKLWKKSMVELHNIPEKVFQRCYQQCRTTGRSVWTPKKNILKVK